MMQSKQVCPSCGLVGMRETEKCSYCIDGRALRSDRELVRCKKCSGKLIRKVGSKTETCQLCRNDTMVRRSCSCGRVFRSNKYIKCSKCRSKELYYQSKTIYPTCQQCGKVFSRYVETDSDKQTCDSCLHDNRRKDADRRRRELNDPMRLQKLAYEKAKEASLKRGKDWELSISEYFKLTASPCLFCGCELTWKTGSILLDRIDNSRGYYLDNVNPCCGDCNMIRGTQLTVDEMCEFMKGVLKYRQAQDDVDRLF